ncbi:hypothetical protein [Lewinella sp. W8]|uniref:hypothetical protein n=1 Tax=Lewinella sp. W8 TaxID=2528208 RepID=UPI0010679741|nr:hypothetical protein [Lewinella sp. W8]MTB49451.1 hypothetical protein [Lewinella sp. W8]
MMYRFLLPLITLSFFLVSCGSDAAEEAGTTDTATEFVEESDEERLSKIAPPPPVCVFLTEAEVLGLFAAGVQVPLPGHRAATSYNSCQYELTSPDWSGTLIVEMPEEPSGIQSIIDEVAGAKGADAVKIGEYSARIKNEGRIISVEAGKPFRVKFSALPLNGKPAPFDEAARRELIIKMAEGVLAV